MIYQPFLGEIKGVAITKEYYYRVMEEIVDVFKNEHGIKLSKDLIKLHLKAMEYAEKKGVDPYEFKRDCLSSIYSMKNFSDYRFIRKGEKNFYYGFNKALHSCDYEEKSGK